MIKGPEAVGNQQPAPGTGPQRIDPVAQLKSYLTRNEKPAPEAEVADEETVEHAEGFEADVDGEDQEQPERVEDESEDEPEENEKTGLPPEFYAKTVKAVVNGEELEITVEEAAKGYQRLQDYTRKSQEVARARQEFVNSTDEYKKGIEVIAQFLNQESAAYDKIDWDALKAADPQTYSVKKLEAQESKQKMALLQQTWKEADSKAKEAQMNALKEVVEVEAQRLNQALPEWNHPEKGSDFKKSVMKFAVSQGFTPAEVQQVIDHRYLVILNKARMYEELMSKQGSLKGKLVTPGNKVVKGGSRPAPGPQDNVLKAAQRLATNQTQDAAKNYILAKWAKGK